MILDLVGLFVDHAGVMPKRNRFFFQAKVKMTEALFQQPEPAIDRRGPAADGNPASAATSATNMPPIPGLRLLPHNPAQLKLGKGVSFVKSRLLRIHQEDDVWEADFLALPCPSGIHADCYVGLVFDQTGNLLREIQLETRPAVNDLARLLADAMLRPFHDLAHRPASLILRDRKEWADLLPHLKQIRIDVQLKQALPVCDAVIRESEKRAEREMKRKKKTTRK